MKIIELNIIEFGKFKNFDLSLDNGLNVIKGDNESGKSTLLAFIKFILYGVGRKNPNVAVGERERALSWNTGVAAGSLTVEDIDGKRYRIERAGREGARGAYSDKVRIIDLATGNEFLSLGDCTPGEHFLGVNSQGYDSMCNIKQLEATLIGSDAVKGAIDNLLSSGDESMNVQAAVKSLDTERRRLLHTNGKGGLLYDSEMALERLRNEYRGATVFENECIKNLDELERVELALEKARDEHRLAQKMCDLHDDVLRLEKFDRLKELKTEMAGLSARENEQNRDAGFDVRRASYEKMAQMQNISEALSKSRVALTNAREELKDIEKSRNVPEFVNPDGLRELIGEFGSPKSALAYFESKKKKKRNGALAVAFLGVAGILLLALAAYLAFGASNPSGAATVMFVAVILLIAMGASYKKISVAGREIKEFMSKMGAGFCPKDHGGMLEELQRFYNYEHEKSELDRVLENARFRLFAAEDTFGGDLERACEELSMFDVCPSEGNETELLGELCDKMRTYLLKKEALDDEKRNITAIFNGLSAELERFSEADIRSRITPEIVQKIQSVSFEKLKAERDAALYKTNQFSQYKAGIERNLASSGQRTPSGEIFPKIESEKARLEGLKLRLDAVRLAMETINSASLELKSDITPKIREEAQKNISVITGGKYNELYITENMGLSVFAGGATRPIDSLSKGSLDAAYFAVRLALTKTLLGAKQPPLCMDELLSQLDDGRAENVLRVIGEYAKDSQCVLFTCQNRDVELAQKVHDSVNVIRL